MIRAIIIDDEAHIRGTLTILLQSYCRKIEVVSEDDSVKTGILAVNELHPDLIFLDINMKYGTGFDLLNAFSIIEFKVIFISAFDKNTIQAFKLSGLEYLMKPVNPWEITAAINRLITVKGKDFAVQLEALEMNMQRFKSDRTDF